ncbi:PD-(D/E)XK nuclease family protein [Streptomyces sp. NBC_00237]|uniref:RecB family exonuclease n=1 Tax=Streptomyces sp. NBC_00237 TaxID=2975687 RepID=UPI00225A02F1|nr:PD-(D/E)XK nuclease family protein [Streptomyces sp. NBC_00237]MCX5201501.1 PD-(D/E)XK nuclease family protein [Streptomyces sp. NBC_00237]
MTRSPSQLEQYINKCPWQYYLQRVEGVVSRPAAWSHQGTSFHTACEVYEGASRAMHVEDVQEVFHEQYTALVDASLDQEPDTDRWMTAGPSGADDIAQRYTLGMQQTAAYVAWAEKNEPQLWESPGGQRGIELHLTAEISGIKVQGYVDQVIQEPDGSLRIRDLKTGSTKSKFQLQTYGILARKVLGAEVNSADWYLAKSGGLSRTVNLSGVTEGEVGTAFRALDEGVKAGNFPAKPGFHCRFCDVSHACEYRR